MGKRGRKPQNDGLKEYKKFGINRRGVATLYAKRHILNGDTRDEIIEQLMERYGYAQKTAGDIYAKGLQYSVKEFVEDAEVILHKNMQRLEDLIEANLEDDNTNDALKAIDMQNKLSGNYETKVAVKNDGEDAPAFKIKIE